MFTLEQGSTPREELELLNGWRAQWKLPTFVGFKTANGYSISWEEGSEPLYEIAGGADGIFYRDLREPHIVVDETGVTVTTAVSIWTPARTLLPTNYWRVGKAVKITAFGKWTSGATPGNLTVGIGYGAGNNPTPTVNGAAVAAVASRTNDTWRQEGYVECRSIGATGTVRFWGKLEVVPAMITPTTYQPWLIPATTPADSTIDTTVGTNAVTFQWARSGSTTETVTTTNLLFEALN